MKSSKALLGFSFFAVLATLLTYTIWSTLQRSVPGNTTSYSAVFTDVLGLRIGDDVRMAGVRVGRIDKIDFTDNYIAKVDFQIEARQHLTDTTKALVRYQNLIGQRYLALAPGTGEGAVVPMRLADPARPDRAVIRRLGAAVRIRTTVQCAATRPDQFAVGNAHPGIAGQRGVAGGADHPGCPVGQYLR